MVKWTLNDIPDMTGKTVVVTGGNTGLGFICCKKLVEKNAKVYLASRDSQKTRDAFERIKEETGKNNLELLSLDLSDLDGVRKTAEEFLRKENQLHVLINNAGVMAAPVDKLTKDGYDIQFGVNVLGHFHLTTLLLPTILNTPEARIVNVTSAGHQMCFSGGFDWDHLKGPKKGTWIPVLEMVERYRYYGQSKLGNILFTNELVRRYGDKGLVAISTHPGVIHTELMREHAWYSQAFIRPALSTPEQGAITQLFAATAPEAKNLSGKYLVPVAQVATPSRLAQNEALGIKMWEYCEQELKNY